MTNPDWAERLQRTRKREYNKGIAAERERIIKLLEEQLPGAKRVGIFYTAGMQDAIKLIKEEINETNNS
jgi:hypothetical protein